MEVAPFFVDFHHFLSIFTIFHRFSRFTHFCRDLHFVVIYAVFLQIFLAKIADSATSHVFCMYGNNMGKNESQTVFLNTQTSLTFDLPVLKSSTTTKYENQEIIFPLETSRLVPRALAMLCSSGHFLLSICHAGAAFIENDD